MESMLNIPVTLIRIDRQVKKKMEKMKDVKLGKEKVGDYWSPLAKENSAVDALAASSVRSNLGRILPMVGT